MALAALLAGCHPRPGPESTEGRAPADAEQTPLPLAHDDYPWPKNTSTYEALVRRFVRPPGFTQVELSERSWGQWLRHLPLRPKRTPVVSHGGRQILSGLSPNLAGVVDMDVRENQECADLILRLRGEYLRWAGREAEIAFELTEGGSMSWPEWKRGMRPRWDGRRLRFRETAQGDSSRASFDAFLASVFAWCGTYSLSQEGNRVTWPDVRVGDFFVHGGSPGHAVLIVDLVTDADGNRRALLLQGYMPAQSAHILATGASSPWFELDPDKPVDTPIWGAFEWSELRRFRDRGA